MDLAEATTVLNEILAALENTGLERYEFELRTKGGSKRYCVCIKAFLGTVRKQQVEAIAEKHGLKTEEQANYFVLS